jgi:hypothetical protein
MREDTPGAKYAGEPRGRRQRTMTSGLRRARRKRLTRQETDDG